MFVAVGVPMCTFCSLRATAYVLRTARVMPRHSTYSFTVSEAMPLCTDGLLDTAL